MRIRLLQFLKYLLTVVGRNVSSSSLRKVEAVKDYVAVGRWLEERGLDIPSRVRDRRAVWSALLQSIQDEWVLYLEFGVYKGTATRFWSQGLTNSKTLLHGFDSFEGLPAAGGPWEKQQFDVSGQLPVIDDSRVTFFKGWFDEVLPGYRLPPHDILVINIDADLYDSAKCVLKAMRASIRPGTRIYFDELNHVEHEARAFGEFLDETKMAFRVVSADWSLAHVAFECIGNSPAEPLVPMDEEKA